MCREEEEEKKETNGEQGVGVGVKQHARVAASIKKSRVLSTE